ncbi:MAG: phage tail family protein [Ruminococcus sp.]|nr:phage tail family protein [Ruminococcus sp.]
MYNFVNTTERASAIITLPAEALSINGTYIENVVDGYRTLYVTGRELLESEIRDLQIGQSDGTIFQGKRNPVREITVTYRIMSKSAESFREKFNALSSILEPEEARLVFADEPDKYYIGTKSSIGEVQGGLLNVIGNFTFYCCNPYKHSTTEKTFSASLNADGIMEATIVNNGTSDTPISYEIKHNHENGYIGIVSQYGAMQYGYVDEIDGEMMEKSQVLLNYQDGTAMNSMPNASGTGNQGPFKVITYNGKSVLALQDTGVTGGAGWEGARKTMVIPADSNGVQGSENFYAKATVSFGSLQIGVGRLEFSLIDTNNQNLATIYLIKSNLLGSKSYAVYHVQGQEVKSVEFNSNMSTEGYPISISKSQGEIKFYFNGETFPYSSSALANVKAKTVSLHLGAYGVYGMGQLIPRLFFHDLMFRKDNVQYWKEIPNRYRAGSVVYVDGNTRKIYTDGINSLEDEMVGTQYFNAPPGQTKVQFYYSDFSIPPPTIKAKIREAYL